MLQTSRLSCCEDCLLLGNVLGGWSQALKWLLRRLFLHETSPAKGGIPFTVSGYTPTVYASVTDMISDGDGHRQGLEWIGASGLKPCLLHHNVFSKRSGIEGGEGVLVTCHEHSKFVLNDNDSLYHSADLMLAAQRLWAEGSITKSRRDDSQKGHRPQQ